MASTIDHSHRRRPKLIVANPDPDGSDSERRQYSSPPYQYFPPPIPVPSYPQRPLPNQPPTIHTKAWPNELQSNPPPSSPSTAAEDTPSPSTPSLPGPVSDVSNPPSIQEPSSSYPTERAQSSNQHVSESFRMHPLHQYPKSTPPQKRSTTVLATLDSEKYVAVDINDAANAAAIRELIFSKLDIVDDEQYRYSFYEAEIGGNARGGPLSDEQLFDMYCRDAASTNKGSLKFLVKATTGPLNTPPASRPSYPPSKNLPPIPIAPVQAAIHPLRPPYKRVQRSRAGSISSTASEQVTSEAGGYEADVDNPDHDTRRPFHRQGPSYSSYAPPTLPNPYPSSPNMARQPSHAPRSTSPLRPVKPVAVPIQDRSRPDISAGGVVAPQISPSQSRFDDRSYLPAPIRTAHNRSSSDAAAEREQILRASEEIQDDANRQWRAHREMGSARDTYVDLQQRPRRIQQSESNRGSHVEGLRITPRNTGPVEPHFRISRGARQSSSSRGVRIQDLSIPRPPLQPPPKPDSRGASPAKIPSQIFHLPWTGEASRPEDALKSRRLGKGSAKSMDNLRAVSTSQHPVNLQPGRRAQLPINPAAPPTQSKQYDSSRRPGGYYAGNGLDYIQSPGSYLRQPNPYNPSPSSPVHEPYPRPSSAISDSPPTPTPSYLRQGQPVQSPVYDAHHVSSPPLIPNSSTSSRTTTISTVFSEPPDPHSGSETPITAVSLTPISPKSPRQERFISSNFANTSNGNFDTRPSGVNVDRVHESTLTQGDLWLVGVINTSDSGDGTVIPSQSKLRQQLQASQQHQSNQQPFSQAFQQSTQPSLTQPSISVTQATTIGSSSSYQDVINDDSDSDGDLWQKAPANPPPKPPLQVNTAQSQSTLRPQLRQQGTSEYEPNTFNARRQSTWAPRPEPEDVFEHPEQFFPQHDLDKPVIEAATEGNSPTTAVPVPTSRMESGRKVSLRGFFVEQKKRIYRISTVSSSSVTRKRSTKVWGSRAEEVTTHSKIGSSNGTDPSGRATFKWVRGELIGKGTYGRVYLAMNVTTGEMIAVKQVELPRTPSDRNDSRQATVVQALKSESETLKDLDHPNIVQYLGFEETTECLSIFLEYVPGGSVGSCLQRYGRFDEDVTKSFTSQILSGLEYLHSKGILHRDLKADNILVEPTGVCKISDFGISKRTDDHAAHTALQGTVFWMAPEVINTQKKGYNSKIDIWSIGCVVLEMWAGIRPWNGDEAVAVMFKLYSAKLPPPVPKDVILSDLAEDFRKKCFAIDPEERPTAAELRKHPYLILPPGWVFTGFT
ncbi:hypothetical protein AX16_006490 [Volvariella volvacea WC 439]|nr:hypothetical protein AX16_006490 [Volvariella volvacea WC 439]